jgi:hypothetical protein
VKSAQIESAREPPMAKIVIYPATFDSALMKGRMKKAMMRNEKRGSRNIIQAT